MTQRQTHPLIDPTRPHHTTITPRTGTVSSKPGPENFNRTLLKKFSSPPQPLLELREPINQTLLKNFSADPA